MNNKPRRTYIGVIHFYWKEAGQYSRTTHEVFTPRAVQARDNSEAWKELCIYANQHAAKQHSKPYFSIPAVEPINLNGVAIPDTAVCDGVSAEGLYWSQEGSDDNT